MTLSHCLLGTLAGLLMLAALLFSLFAAVPALSRRRLSSLLALGEQNDVCGLIRETWNASDVICQTHDVWTPDGYGLRLKRLLPIHNPRRGVVFLVPGLGDSSGTFVISGPTDSLAGVLWSSGFEIWLLDGRGKAPFGHRRGVHPDSAEYWDWSFDEKIKYDIPTAVEYSLNISQAKSLSGLVGHSQGALLILLTLAQYPKLPVERAFLLAPPITGWSPQFALPKGLFFPLLQYVLPTHNVARIVGSVRSTISRTCLLFPSVCASITCLASGCGQQSKITATRLADIFTFYPVASSLKNAEHLMHCERNSAIILKYGSPVAEQVVLSNFSQIQTPLYFFFGSADNLVDKRRFDNGPALFTPGIVRLYKILDYGHADFVWGETAREHIYDDIVYSLKS